MFYNEAFDADSHCQAYGMSSLDAAEEELSQKQALSNTLQGLCRALQTQNANLSKQLEESLSRRHKDGEQSAGLQKAVSDITTRYRPWLMQILSRTAEFSRQSG